MAERPDEPALTSDARPLTPAPPGPLPALAATGLAASSHPSPEFATPENEFIVKLRSEQPVKVSGKAIRLPSGRDSPERVFVQTHRSLVNVFVSLPEPGDYRLQLYALPASDPSPELPNVFNYLVHCTGAPRRCRLFPRQFARWRDGCALYEPFSLAGDRARGDVPFRVRIPDALAAAVTVGEEWTHLEPADDGVWKGVVCDVGRLRGRSECAVLNANFDPDDEARYSSLLAYRL